MQPHTVLVIGGHGRTARVISTLLLSHGHTVYSLIRHSSQIPEIVRLAEPFPDARIVPVMHDLNGISRHEIYELLTSGAPGGGFDWVIWAAGAKSNVARHPVDQLAVERDAALGFIDEARGEGVGGGVKVKRFIVISACICRREAAQWWTGSGRKYWERVCRDVMPTYVEAKTEVDEILVSQCLAHASARRERQAGTGGSVVEDGEAEGSGSDKGEESFSAVSVRPGTLCDGPATGTVSLGRTALGGEAVSREDLARVVVELCEATGGKRDGGGIGCRWLDVGPGTEPIHEAVRRCIDEDVNTMVAETKEDRIQGDFAQ